LSVNTRDDTIVYLRLIGSMQAMTVTGHTVLPTGRKTRALLAAIALSEPEPVSQSSLANLLWSQRNQIDARASLRQELEKLLMALAPAETEILHVTHDHLMLNHGAVWIDVEDVTNATPGNPGALSLLGSELLECMDGIDPAFDQWLSERRRELHERARNLAELVLRRQTEPHATILAAKRLLRIDSIHEGAWRALMREYASIGEHGMAAHAYDQCRRTMAACVNAAPSEETQQLLAAIRRHRIL
jgi:DNA-binding SARP family transcriptional activator